MSPSQGKHTWGSLALQTPSAVSGALLPAQPLPGPFIGEGAGVWGGRTAPTPSHQAASVEEESPARQHREMVQRQRGHPVEPCPTARPLSSVELRYLPPASAAAVAQGSAPAGAGCCGSGVQWVPERFCSPGVTAWVHQGVTAPKICVCLGKEDAGTPQHLRVRVRLQDHLPSDTRPGTFRESKQGTSVCQATTMACTDSQIHSGLSFGCFFP